MTNMPGNVSRARVMRLADEHLNKNWGNRRTMLLNLFDGLDIAEVFKKAKIGTPKERLHIQRHFLGTERSKGAYWPDDQWGYLGNKQEITRIGLIESIRVSEGFKRSFMIPKNFRDNKHDERVPKSSIETLWICAGTHYETNVCEMSDTRVNQILLTPSFPHLPDKDKEIMLTPAQIFIVAQEREIQHIVDYYPARQEKRPPVFPANTYPIKGKKRELKDLDMMEKWEHDR